MSNFDNFDSIFREVIRLTESLFEAQDNAPTQVSDAVPVEKEERDELIERGDSFNYILDAPGYEEGQLGVSVLDDRIEVKAPDFVAGKPFPTRVDPGSAVSKYRNGILSVTVRKKR